MTYQMTVPKVRSIIDDYLTDADGAFVIGRAVTALLHVCPNGNDGDGSTWASAYTTIQAALDAASTDTDDCTLILISPHTTNYDINTTGDPTWAANVILKGTHRNWAKIKNTHASATSIMKLTGKSSAIDLNFNLGTGNNGLIMTHGGCRGYHLQFVGEDLTSAKTGLWLDGAAAKHAKFEDIHILGESASTKMTGILVDQFAHSYFEKVFIHYCLAGIKFAGTSADINHFNAIDIGHCGIGLDIDAGNGQHFTDILFHDNTTNVDDEVGDHHWNNIRGSFPIIILPDDLNGTSVPTHANANTYGTATTIVAARDKPYRIVGITLEPSTSEWYEMKLKDGTTYFDYLLFEANKREASAFPSGTEFIFNKGIAITAELKDEGGGDTCNTWVEIQEI